MIIDLVFNLLIIIVIMFSFYYLNKIKRYENNLNKRVLSFLSLTLFVFIVKSFARIMVTLNLETILLSPMGILIYDYLIVLCVLSSLYYMKDLEIIH